MAMDMVVALGPATVGRATLVGLNQHGPAGRKPRLKRFAGRNCTPDESLVFEHCTLPQSRQLFTVLGSQSQGMWGLTHGINAHHVVAGCSGWNSKIQSPREGLRGTDLVRLVLERSHSAAHAVEVLTDLVARCGQIGPEADIESTDSLFLLADAAEAYVVETAGRFWAVQECHQVRAVSDVALIRQDWCRLAPGLATHAEQSGWWQNDGSKLDFAGRLAAIPSNPFALKRWGRATLLLEQQNGHLDVEALRRLLIEHFEDTVVRRHPQAGSPAPKLCTTFSARMPQEEREPAIVWIGLGPTGNDLFFPILLEGDLPALLERGPMGHPLTPQPGWMTDSDTQQWQEEISRLQQHLDEQTEEFSAEYRILKREGDEETLARRATTFMQRQAERLDGYATTSSFRPHNRLREMELAFVAE